LNDVPLSILGLILAVLILFSAFFSGSETGLISLNRYRLRYLAKANHRGAKCAQKLLDKPDRLIGLILLGNNFVNILSSAVATTIATRLWGVEAGIAIATVLLTLVILIFAEVAPKTLAVMHPERIALPASLLLRPMLFILYPVVWGVNLLANGVLRIIGIPLHAENGQSMSQEELRTVLSEADAMIPRRHKQMLTNILDLQEVTVNDIMVPRSEIIGIDLDDDWDTIYSQLINSQHTRFPVYREDINNIVGALHVRNCMHLLSNPNSGIEELKKNIREAYYVPENTPLNTQLLQFQRQKRRMGMVVDEYGDVLGLVTLEDILEEIVGEFTSEPLTSIKDIHPQEDGTYLVDGSANIRELNRSMGWELPSDGPKTFNGLIIEHLESIPEPGTSVLIAGYPIEIVQSKENTVKTARVSPRLKIAVSNNQEVQ